MRHIHTCNYPQEAIRKYCTHLHHTLAALKRYFTVSLVAPLPNKNKNHPFSNHIYTKSTLNKIHHYYASFVTLTYITHIISSIAPTYAPHCHPAPGFVNRPRPVTALLATWTETPGGGTQA